MCVHNLVLQQLHAGLGTAAGWWAALEADVYPAVAALAALPPAELGGGHSRGYIGGLQKAERALRKLAAFVGVEPDATVGRAVAAARLRGAGRWRG